MLLAVAYLLRISSLLKRPRQLEPQEAVRIERKTATIREQVDFTPGAHHLCQSSRLLGVQFVSRRVPLHRIATSHLRDPGDSMT